MQLHIDFSTDLLNLPIAYNSILQGFIYHTLETADPAYSDAVHNKGREKSLNESKDFTFGRLTGSYDIRGREIIFPQRASLEIRSADERFIQKLLLGLSEGEWVKLGTNAAKIESLRAENRIITRSSLAAYCLSPFTFRAPFSECNIFDASLARKKLLDNAFRKWTQAGHDEADFALDIEFTGAEPKKSQVVFKTISIIAWDTPFILRGNAPVLDFLYNTGVGKSNSQGFGMFGIREDGESPVE